MSSNKQARKELERIYGKKDMFVEARIAEQIEARGGIRTYKQYKKHCKYKRSKEKLLEKRLSMHHLVHRSDRWKINCRKRSLNSSVTT